MEIRVYAFFIGENEHLPKFATFLEATMHATYL
jgi:hypothetical protein